MTAKSTEPSMKGDMTVPVKAEAIGPHVITQMQAGVLPVEAFREVAVGKGGSNEPTEAQDRPGRDGVFGTHIREAANVLRRRR